MHTLIIVVFSIHFAFDSASRTHCGRSFCATHSWPEHIAKAIGFEFAHRSLDTSDAPREWTIKQKRNEQNVSGDFTNYTSKELLTVSIVPRFSLSDFLLHSVYSCVVCRVCVCARALIVHVSHMMHDAFPNFVFLLLFANGLKLDWSETNTWYCNLSRECDDEMIPHRASVVCLRWRWQRRRRQRRHHQFR